MPQNAGIDADAPEVPTRLDAAATSRVIEMAWEDRTPFEAIQTQFALDEAAVIALRRQRVRGRKTKHAALRPA